MEAETKKSTEGYDLRTANSLFNPLVILYLSACGMCSVCLCARKNLATLVFNSSTDDNSIPIKIKHI